MHWHRRCSAAVAVVGAALGGSVVGVAIAAIGRRYVLCRTVLIGCRLGRLGGVRQLGLAIGGLGWRLTVCLVGRCCGRLLRVVGLLLLGIERLPVRDRDLVVVGVDFVEGQEAVAIAAIVDERRLERGLHAHDLGEIDVSFELLPGSRFEVEFF